MADAKEANIEEDLMSAFRWLLCGDQPGADGNWEDITKSQDYEAREGAPHRKTSEGIAPALTRAGRAGILRMLRGGMGHCRGDALHLALKKRVWRPRMHATAKNRLKSCSPRRKRDRGASRYQQPGLRAPKSGLFGAVALDFTGPLPRTERGNRCILVAAEYATGWSIAKALPTNLFTDAMQFLHENRIARTAMPAIALSDNGSQFAARSAQEYAKQNGMRWSFVDTYDPQGNGKVERFMRTLKDGLVRAICDDEKSWDLKIEEVAKGYRIRHTREHPSPYHLMFGTEPARINAPTDQHAKHQKDEQRRAIEAAHAMLERQKNKEPIGDMPRERYKVGDRALLARSKRQMAGRSELALRWAGPHCIKDADPPRRKLRATDNRSSKYWTHERRLQPYCAGTATPQEGPM